MGFEFMGRYRADAPNKPARHPPCGGLARSNGIFGAYNRTRHGAICGRAKSLYLVKSVSNQPALIHFGSHITTKAPEITIHHWRRDARRTLAPDAGVHAYIADGETEADLTGIAQFALDHAEELLLVGAAVLGTALARALHLPSARLAVALPPSRVVLFVVGSRTRLSGEQVSQLHRVGIQDILLPVIFPPECVWQPDTIAAKREGGAAFVVRSAQEIVASAADIARAVRRARAELVRQPAPTAVSMLKLHDPEGPLVPGRRN